MGSLSLGPRLEAEVELYVETGPYGNKSEVVRRALEEFFRHQPKETRMVVAQHAYRTRGVTISRAAEIGGVSYEEMRERLKAEGVLHEDAPPGRYTPEERERRAKDLADQVRRRRSPGPRRDK